jgi:hypothetical protein
MRSQKSIDFLSLLPNQPMACVGEFHQGGVGDELVNGVVMGWIDENVAAWLDDERAYIGQERQSTAGIMA